MRGCDCSYLARITATCFSPRGVRISIHCQQSKYGGSRFKIALPASWQQWACPTALPPPDMLHDAGMRGLSLKGESQVVLHNRNCPNSCRQRCLRTPITRTAFTPNLPTASPIDNTPNPSFDQSHQWQQCPSNASKIVAMRRSSRCVREACESCFVVALLS